jgi:hypothetical protein
LADLLVVAFFEDPFLLAPPLLWVLLAEDFLEADFLLVAEGLLAATFLGLVVADLGASF